MMLNIDMPSVNENTFSAPAKVILFGEHAVVYHQPAIAVPVSSLRAQATVLQSQKTGLQIEALDLNEVIPVDIESEIVDNALIQMARLVLNNLNIPIPDLTIKLQSTIPMASGLGSGAAVSTALSRALIAGAGKTITEETLNNLIFEVEKIHHGTPSGIDNTVIVYEKPVYFVRGQPIEVLPIAQPFTLVIADTGHAALTHVAVGDVRELRDAHPETTQPVIDAIGAISKQAKDAITSGDIEKLGPLMNENHMLLQKLTVSSDALDTLVNTAMKAGALGAKLSGGGRGGNMIALTSPEKTSDIESALKEAGAVRVFTTTVA